MCTLQGDILLVAERFDDGWIRGIRMSNLEVNNQHFAYVISLEMT